MEIKSISFPEKAAGRQYSACKTITNYYVGHRGMKVDSVSLPRTVLHPVFSETQRLFHCGAHVCLKSVKRFCNKTCPSLIGEKFVFYAVCIRPQMKQLTCCLNKKSYNPSQSKVRCSDMPNYLLFQAQFAKQEKERQDLLYSRFLSTFCSVTLNSNNGTCLNGLKDKRCAFKSSLRDLFISLGSTVLKSLLQARCAPLHFLTEALCSVAAV